MTTKQFVTMLAVCGCMSMLGGFLSLKVLAGGQPVNAGGDDAIGGAGATVTASKFRLVDDDGKARAGLVVDDEGAVTLIMMDRREKTRMSISCGGRKHPAAFTAFDSKGDPAAMLAVGENNFPLMTLLRGGKICNVMGVNESGQSVISMAHPEGGNCTIVAGKNSPAQMDLTHPSGATLQMFANTNGAAGLEFEHGEKIRAQFMTDEDGNPKINLCNNKQQIIWSAPEK